MNALEFNDIRLSRSKTELMECKFSKVRNKDEVVVKFNVCLVKLESKIKQL